VLTSQESHQVQQNLRLRDIGHMCSLYSLHGGIMSSLDRYEPHMFNNISHLIVQNDNFGRSLALLYIDDSVRKRVTIF
jgi:hypothetical protein